MLDMYGKKLNYLWYACVAIYLITVALMITLMVLGIRWLWIHT